MKIFPVKEAHRHNVVGAKKILRSDRETEKKKERISLVIKSNETQKKIITYNIYLCILYKPGTRHSA